MLFTFQVIQRYYVQYLSGYDAVALKQAMQVRNPVELFDLGLGMVNG